MVVSGQEWFYLGKSSCIRAKVVVFGQSGCIPEKIVVFGKSACIVAKVNIVR